MSDISINTNPDSDMFENTYKYPEWYNKKKYIFYNKMLARLKKLSYIHTRASQYYDKMNYYIFGPSISLTAISGIASFLSTSDFVDSESQNAFGVAVGIIASISSVMQSIASACNFSAKQEGHRSAAEQYNNLIVKTKFEIEMPNEENYADDLEKMILDIQGKCNFFPPQFIVDEYEKKHKENRIDNNLEGTYELPRKFNSKPKPVKKMSKKNYDTFNKGTSIIDFSIQNTHDSIDDHVKIQIADKQQNLEQSSNPNIQKLVTEAGIDKIDYYSDSPTPIVTESSVPPENSNDSSNIDINVDGSINITGLDTKYMV